MSREEMGEVALQAEKLAGIVTECPPPHRRRGVGGSDRLCGGAGGSDSSGEEGWGQVSKHRDGHVQELVLR